MKWWWLLLGLLLCGLSACTYEVNVTVTPLPIPVDSGPQPGHQDSSSFNV